MTAWNILEQLFRESKQYRGDTSIRYQDLQKMIMGDGTPNYPGLKGGRMDKNGAAFDTDYGFTPSIWGKWYPSQDPALTMASTDKDVVGQYAGRPQGGTIHKANWGGKVSNVPGKARGDFERMHSAMDRYDILMQGEVTKTTKVNPKTGQTQEVEKGRLYRVAYSPSVGSSEERRARLLALMAGQTPGPLGRRPQPEVSTPSKDDLQKWDGEVAKAHGIQGRRRAAADAEDAENTRRAARGLPPLPPDTDED